jgi:CheY-like chemotaxis protein
MNLISNAAEAMPDGGTITVSSENTEIDKPIKGYPDIKTGGYTIVTVSDTGVGIAPEEMERIFEPFYTKKVMGRSGTGLGMAVVWGSVHDHDGYIDIKSTLGKGTTFLLYFPATDQPIQAEKEQISMDRYKGNGESILVVDDVEEQRKIADKILSKLGYFVSTASSGEEAVKFIQNHSADLVILDMIMDPGIDGLETYRRIIETHPDQKSIIASGFSETERVKEIQRLGAGEYIRKPYSMEKIGMAVKKALAD